MKAQNVNFEEVFDSLPEAVAICDEEGRLVSVNRRSRRLLGVKPGDALRLHLNDRETVQQMRISADEPEAQEFYLADVRIEGAVRERVSVSLRSLSGGGYRVAFTPGKGEKQTSPNVRILEPLVHAGRHLDLFKAPDKVLTLFGACLPEVFPEYSFRIRVQTGSLDSDLEFEHTGWGPDVRREVDSELRESGHVDESQLLWTKSRTGYCVALEDFGGLRGTLHVERREAERFSVEEREAFETFAQQLGFALERVAQRDDFEAVVPILDQLDAVVVICDERRRILVSNKTFEEIAGEPEIVGADILGFFSEESATRLRTVAASVMASGASAAFEATLRPRDSSRDCQAVLQLQVAPNRTHGESQASSAPGFIVTGQQSNVSILELEERLNRAEHLMNLGQMATGVAHELKNPLTSILNYADYLMRKYQDTLFEDRDSERLQRIIDGVQRIDAFVRDLMTLARPMDDRMEEFEIGRAIREAASLCEVPVRQNHAVLEIDDARPGLFVRGVESQLKQVFINLITNAAKAMPETGGTIRVEARARDDEVVCRVVDDALGMSEETRSRIFEPFFTTREGEDGSGLGLAIVRNIMQGHSGQIEVESVPGEGTTFTLRFPRAGQAP